MSEREQRVLDQLEQEFRQPATARALSGYSRLGKPKAVATAAAALPCALLFVILGVALDNAAGIVVALVAYALIVCAVAVLVDCTSRTRAALVRRARSLPTYGTPRNLR